MKYINFVLAIALLALSFAIYTVPQCTRCNHCQIEWAIPAATDLFQLNKPIEYQMNSDNTELDVKLNFNSGFADDAYLVVYAEKEYASTLPSVLDGFKDNLKINGFHVRSYFIQNGYHADEVITSVDYPVYVKNISVKKGINRESFKIVFPRNIASMQANVSINVGIVRYSNEIKDKFENHTTVNHGVDGNELFGYENYKNLFFESFPDSSKTALAFSNFDFLFDLSILADGKNPKISIDGCCGEFRPPSYSNFDSDIIKISTNLDN